jgi:hypothetical protein
MNDEGLADVEAANPFVYPDCTQEWLGRRLRVTLLTDRPRALKERVGRGKRWFMPTSARAIIGGPYR